MSMKSTGYAISLDEFHIIMHLPREKKEPLYSKLHRRSKTDENVHRIDKQFSVIVVRLPKLNSASSNDFFTTSCASVFLF